DFEDHEGRMRKLADRYLSNPDFVRTKTRSTFGQALEAYFEGGVNMINGLTTIALGTAFQAKVWAALRTIPAGHTRSYAEIARQIGTPKGMRAVGLANGANPIGIVVPCHRVIGANGTLTGYGGGLPRKEWLLKHEAAWAARNFALSA
ncbi:MAG TPA: cysteine methyltransferase, partial [Alphaproteobacteria bacterium]|nr:cysteine methyltransferase [Alphaproteobacteria bacterium]